MTVVFAMVGHLINLISGFKRAGPSDRKTQKGNERQLNTNLSGNDSSTAFSNKMFTRKYFNSEFVIL